MIEATLKSSSGDSQSNARLAYVQANDVLENFILTVVETSKVKKLPVFYKLVDDTIETLLEYIASSATVKSEYPIRKPARYAVSVLKTLRNDVEEKTTTLTRVQKIATTKIKDYLLDMQDANEILIQANNANPVSDAEKDFISTRDALRKYSKYQRKLPNKLKRPDSFQIAEIPVLARFSGRIGSVAFLKSLNVDYTPIGFEKKSSDIGIIFEKQNLLMFSKSSAIEDAHAMFKEDAHDQGLDGKKQSASRRNAMKRIKLHYTKMAQMLNITSRPEIKEFVDDQIKEDKSDGRVFDLSRTLKAVFKNNKALIKEVSKEINKEKEAIGNIYLELDQTAKTQKELRAKLNARKRSKLKDSTILLSYANAAVDEISKQTGHDYVILSPNSIKSPRNADIVLFWIVPKVFAKILSSFSGEGIKVNYWDLPWSKSKVKTSDRIPESIDLSVKLPRTK